MTDAQLTNIKNRELALAHFKAAIVEMMLASIDEVIIRKTFFEFAELVGISPFQGMFQTDPAKQATEYIKERELGAKWEIGDIGIAFLPTGEYLGRFVIDKILVRDRLFEGHILAGGGNASGVYQITSENLKRIPGQG